MHHALPLAVARSKSWRLGPVLHSPNKPGELSQ